MHVCLEVVEIQTWNQITNILSEKRSPHLNVSVKKRYHTWLLVTDVGGNPCLNVWAHRTWMLVVGGGDPYLGIWLQNGQSSNQKKYEVMATCMHLKHSGIKFKHLVWSDPQMHQWKIYLPAKYPTTWNSQRGAWWPRNTCLQTGWPWVADRASCQKTVSFPLPCHTESREKTIWCYSEKIELINLKRLLLLLCVWCVSVGGRGGLRYRDFVLFDRKLSFTVKNSSSWFTCCFQLIY